MLICRIPTTPTSGNPMPRVNIVLPDEVLADMDQVAREEGLNRSQLIRVAFQVFTEKRAENNERRIRQADIQRAMEIQDALRRSATSWDPLQVLRDQRKRP